MVKSVLLVVSLCGSLFFTTLFGLTYGVPDGVERAGQNFIKSQIEHEFYQYSDQLSVDILENSHTEKLNFFKKRFQKQIDATQAELDAKIPEMIASVIASMCRLDCDAKQKWTDVIHASYADRLSKLGVSVDRMNDFIQGKYYETLTGLKLDLRMFFGSNAVLFLLVLVISIIKSKAIRHLYLPAGLLLIATIISIAIYIFGQNWFFVILYNDFMGFGYLLYVSFIFAILCDIGFNKARVTSAILNLFSNVSFIPC